MLYRRRLPHVYAAQRPVFLTWRLHGSLSPNRQFPYGTPTGRIFAILDRLLDETRQGPFHLRQPAIAEVVVDAIQHGARALGHYSLHAYAVMPNHVHLLVTPAIPIPRLTQSLKAVTARRANALLRLTGRPFWQEETFDHTVRDSREFERIRNYIERNPVRAGLVSEAREYRWSSARASCGSPAEHGSALL